MKRKKSLYLLLVLVGVIAAGFGFAAMSRALTIDGTAYIGPDSNNFKVFYSNYRVDEQEFARPNKKVEDMYATASDIGVTFTNSAGQEITGKIYSGDNLDGNNATGMHVNLPAGALLHVNDTIVIHFGVKNYGGPGYAAAKIDTALPWETTYKYYECTKSTTELGGFDCNTNASTTYTQENSPLEVTIIEETTNTGWWTAPTASGTKGIMNPGTTAGTPGEGVAYKMTIKYAKETERLLKANFSIEFNAVETDPHS